MRRIAALAALLVMAGCQADRGQPVDVSSRMTTPVAQAHMKSAYQRETVGNAAVDVHCAAQWIGQPEMVEFCKEAQRPKMRQFEAAKLNIERIHARDKTLFANEVKSYRACQAAHAGDYEMATECVKAERQVRVLARNQ